MRAHRALWVGRRGRGHVGVPPPCEALNPINCSAAVAVGYDARPYVSSRREFEVLYNRELGAHGVMGDGSRAAGQRRAGQARNDGSRVEGRDGGWW